MSDHFTPISQAPAGQAVPMQVPPINIGESVRIKFKYEAQGELHGLVALIATGSNPNLGGTYAQDTEYWNYRNRSFDVGALVMTLESGPYSAQDIEDYLKNYQPAFTADETVPSGAWAKGTLGADPSDSSYLFKAPDPDDGSVCIGLLLEQSQNGTLRMSAWYKTSQPADGWVWSPSKAPTRGLKWSRVLDAKGAPSTNPHHIQSGISWYHAIQS